MAGLTLKWFIFLGRFWMDASAGVAKLPDSTSCIPKHSGGREPPDGYHKMGTATAPGDGTGCGGQHHSPCATPSICLGTGAVQKSAISSYFSVLQTGQMWDAHTLPTQPVHRQK